MKELVTKIQEAYAAFQTDASHKSRKGTKQQVLVLAKRHCRSKNC